MHVHAEKVCSGCGVGEYVNTKEVYGGSCGKEHGAGTVDMHVHAEVHSGWEDGRTVPSTEVGLGRDPG